MDLPVLLQILKEVSVIIQALRDMGVKIEGNVKLADLIALAKKG